MEALDIFGSEFVGPLPHCATDASLPLQPGQSENVYAWEIINFPGRDAGGMSLDECRELIRKIWKDTLRMKENAPAVYDGRGSMCARYYNNAIHLPRWSRNRLIVIHELAHAVTGLLNDVRSSHHDGLYLQVYFTLLDLEGDYKYDWLKHSALKYGLKVSRVDLVKKLKKYQIECQSE